MRSILFIHARVLLLSLAGVAPVAAQAVHGTVVEEGSGHPVAGGFVVLLGEDEEQQGASLTDKDGRFRIDAPGGGQYRLGVDRIGYLSVTTPLFPIPAGRKIEYRLSVRVEPVELAGIDVAVDSACHVRPGMELPSAQVWEEVRKALNATAWTQREGLLRYTVVATERRLDPWTRRVEDERQRTHSGLSRGSPYVALDAGRLAAEGFARVDDETQVYYAPDATTLLSDWFLDNHCFRLTPASETEPGLVGLGFEPTGQAGRIDVRGTLWLDGRTAELSALDFDYTGLPASMGRVEAGGRVEFDRLASGEWIVARWEIRMPVVRWAAPNVYSHLSMDPSKRGPVLLAYEEDSGRVIDVASVGPADLATGGARRFPSVPILLPEPPVASDRPQGLPADPLPAEPLEVVVETEKAATRARGEGGYVITADDIPETPLPLGRILERRIPGLRYVMRGGCSTLHTRAGVVMLVVLDGQRIHDTCVLSLVRPEDVERIEFLPSLAASTRYGDAGGGGVLVIETRRAH